jgi:hypothetical protein
MAHEVRIVTRDRPPSTVKLPWAGPAYQARCSCGEVFDWCGLRSTAEQSRDSHLDYMARVQRRHDEQGQEREEKDSGEVLL